MKKVVFNEAAFFYVFEKQIAIGEHKAKNPGV